MATGIGRRRFLPTLGDAALGWPFAARAQHTGKISQIGLLYPGVAAMVVPRIEALREGLRAINYEDADRVVDGPWTPIFPARFVRSAPWSARY